MKSIQVSLPAALSPHIEARVAEGQFKDAGDYLSFLVCEDKARASVPTFEEELTARLRAEPAPVSDADVQRIKREIRDRRLQELRMEIAKGIEQANRGEVAPLDVESIIAEGKRRLASRRVKQGAAG